MRIETFLNLAGVQGYMQEGQAELVTKQKTKSTKSIVKLVETYKEVPTKAVLLEIITFYLDENLSIPIKYLKEVPAEDEIWHDIIRCDESQILNHPELTKLDILSVLQRTRDEALVFVLIKHLLSEQELRDIYSEFPRLLKYNKGKDKIYIEPEMLTPEALVDEAEITESKIKASENIAISKLARTFEYLEPSELPLAYLPSEKLKDVKFILEYIKTVDSEIFIYVHKDIQTVEMCVEAIKRDRSLIGYVNLELFDSTPLTI